MTWSEQLRIVRTNSDEYRSQKALRKKKEYTGKCTSEEFQNLSNWWEEKSGGRVNTQESVDGMINYSRKISQWELFENKVWRIISSCGMKYASSDLQVVKYGDGAKQLKQLDGIFADDDYVYIVEAKYRTKRDGEDAIDSSIRDDVTKIRSFFKPLSKRIIELYPEFSGKEFVFILVTQSVNMKDITPELKIEEFGYSITGNQLDDLRAITKELSTGFVTNSIFRSEVMRGRNQKEASRDYYALKTTWSGTTAYSFFADPSEIADRFYVHKRTPDTEANIGMAYQRMMKSSKVAQISTYLQNTDGFFPNSIIAHCDNVKFDPFDKGDVGKLTIPDRIGSIWLIDGQHRVYGSMNSGSNRKLNFCLLVDTEDVQQARLFTTINEKQTKIPLDLIWDLHGSLSTYTDEPTNSSEKEELRKYFISKTWKKMNSDADSPFKGRIVIPSQTKKTSTCHIKFGFLCKYLDQSSLWESGGLRAKKWKNAHLRASNNLKGYFSGIRDSMTDEWEKPDRQNWLLSQYSMMVQIMVYRRAVTTVFNAIPLKDKWSGPKQDARELSYELGKRTAEAIVELGDYGDEIRNAGNSQLRAQWMKKIIIQLMEKYHEYQHIDHGLEMDDDEKKDAHFLTIKEKDTIDDIERLYRKITFLAYKKTYSDDWYQYVPGEVKKTINRGINTRKKFGEEDLEQPSEKYLDSTNLGELMILLEQKKVWQAINKYFACSINELRHNWTYYSLLRHAKAHNSPIPDKNAKTLWLASMKFVKDWGEEAFAEMFNDV